MDALATTDEEELVTPEQFSAWTGGRIPADDPRVQDLLMGASAAVRRYCGWHIAPPRTETVTLDGNGGRVIALNTLHMTDVTEVKANGVVVPSDSYDWSALGNIELRGGQWPRRYRAIEVTLTHGYDEADDVAQIIKQVCAAAISSPMGATREQAGQVSVSWAMTAPNTAGGLSLLRRDLDVLDLYRINVGGL